MKKAFFLFTFSLLAQVMYGQLVFQKNYGGPSDDVGTTIIAESNQTYFITGNTLTYGTGGGALDMIYFKTDPGGFLNSPITYGTNGLRERARGIYKTSDGGYLITGDHTVSGANDAVFVHKLDNTGAQQWVSYFGNTGDNECMSGMQIPLTNFYAIFGFSNEYGSAGTIGTNNSYYRILDNTGANNTIRYLCGTQTEYAQDGVHTATAVYYCGGTNSIGASIGGGFDGLVASYTGIGNTLNWYRSIGGTGNDELFNIESTPSAGGVICVGKTASFGAGGEDIFVVKLDASGNLTWARAIGGGNNETAWSVIVTSDGNYLIAGTTSSSGSGGGDAFLIKINTSGNLVWAKTYGGANFEQFNSVAERPNGLGYAAIGETSSFTNGGKDIYLVATNSTGSSGCNEANWTPTFTNITGSVTIATTGLVEHTAGTNVPAITYTTTTPSPNTTCRCSGALPNLEIQGPTQVCRNQSGLNYYVNSIRGVSNYTWTVNGGSVTPNPGDTSITVNSGTGPSLQIIVSTNLGNCTDFRIDTIMVTVDQIAVNITTADSLLCIGDNTTLNASAVNNQGAVLYTWTPAGSGSSISVSPGSNTNYTVTATDSWSCTATDVIPVSVFSYPVVNLGNDSLYCDVVAVPLNAGNAGATYSWSTSQSSQTINVSTSNTYWVDVTMNGCTTRDSINLLIGTSPVVTIAGSDTTCMGDGEVLTANHTGGTAPYTYVWANSVGTTQSVNVNPATNTTYSVTVTETNGCTGTATLLVRVFSYPVVNLGNDTLQCGSAGPVTLNAQNSGATYDWSTGATSQSIMVNTTNVYWVDVTMNTCTTRDSIQVSYSTNPVVTISGDSAICNGESTTLTGNPTGGTLPYNYDWNTGGSNAAETVSPATNTTYSVVVTDQVGCTGTSSVLVQVTNYPVVYLGNDTIICSGNPLVLDAGNAGFSYNWQDGASTQTYSATSTGTYWVDVTNNNCTTRDSIDLNFDTYPVVNLGADQWICQGEDVILTAANTNATYTWSTGATTDQVTVNTEGIYWVGVSKCYTTVYDTVQLDLDTFSVAVVSYTQPYCGSSNGSITVNPVGGFASYLYAWSSVTDTTATISNITDGTYIVTVTDAEGCTATLSILLDCSVPDIIITQLVSPNGDGKNDTWIIQNILNFPNNTVTINNRWGNEVYKSTGYQNTWDGTPNTGLSIGNDVLPSGTYFYIIDLNGDGQDIRSGYLELQR